jgi:hypothetical protein
MKRPYKKPLIKKVKLAPEEAVLTACKVTMTAAGAGKKCLENNCLNRLQGS